MGRIRYFVGILRILAELQHGVPRSLVRRPPCAHRGARQLILTETQKPRNHAEDSRSSRRAPPLPCATPSSGQANARTAGADIRPRRLPQQGPAAWEPVVSTTGPGTRQAITPRTL